MFADDVSAGSSSGRQLVPGWTTEAETFPGSMTLRALFQRQGDRRRSVGPQRCQSGEDLHVEEETLEGPVGDRQLCRPEGVSGAPA